jgi:CHAD domain-containing protein
LSTEFVLPDDLTVAAARDLLSEHLDLRYGDIRTTERRHYDTFDGLVRDEGLTFVFEDGQLRLVAAEGVGDPAPPAQLGTVVRSEAPERLLADELEQGALRDELRSIIEVRAVLPVAHIRSRINDGVVVNADAKTVVRITLAEPAAVVSERREVQLLPRLRVSGVRGYDEELAEACKTLVDRLGLVAASESLVDEAVRATGGTPGGTSSKIEVSLTWDRRADAAAADVLGRLLEVVKANLPGTLADIDAEFLHDLRVSVRRSRAVQRELKHVFPPIELRRFRDEFRWLQRSTGDARDLDVYVLEFDSMRALLPSEMRTDLDPLLAVLRGRRLIARGEMVQAIGSERTRKLLFDWRLFLDSLPLLPVEGREDAARPIGEVAGERIGKVYKRMVKMGRAIDADSPAEAYHELRKKGKELRYLLELFGAPLYPSGVVKPMVRSLKALQDVLGRHQDREVQVSMLRSLRDEVSALPGGPAALMAMGVLVERLGEDEQAAREEFAARFADFGSKAQRKVVRGTFA